MANTIKIRRSAVQGAIPTTAQLALGELALNTYDGKLYAKKSVDGIESVVELSGGTGGGGSGSNYTFSSTAPAAPSPGDIWTNLNDGATYLRTGDADSYQWVEIGGGSGGTPLGSNYTYSSTPPVLADPGDLWTDSDDGTSYLYIGDGTSDQWVELGGGTGGGGTNYVYSSVEPTSPSVGDVWTDAASGITYYYLEDEDGFQWVELGPSGQRGPVGPKSVTLANPTNSENLILFYTDADVPLAQIRSVLIGSSSPSVTFSVRYGSDISGLGTEVVSGGIVCTSTTTGLGTTMFSNGMIPANNFVWLTTSAVSGNVNALHVTMTFA